MDAKNNRILQKQIHKKLADILKSASLGTLLLVSMIYCVVYAYKKSSMPANIISVYLALCDCISIGIGALVYGFIILHKSLYIRKIEIV